MSEEVEHPLLPQGCPIDMGEEYERTKHAMGHYYDDSRIEIWDIQIEITKRAIKGDKKCVELITGKDRVNFPDGHGNTPLHWVAASSTINPTLIKLLVESGALINATGYGLHLTPLHMAAEAGHPETIRALVELGASLEVQSKEGKTPLIVAAEKGKKQAVEELLNLGANIEATTKTGNIIHVAAWNGFPELVIWLATKIPVDSKNAQSQTPMHLAAWNNHVEVIKALAKCGANVNAVDVDGETPLFHAAHSNQLKAAKELLRLGAKPEITNRHNQTASQLAEQKQYKEVARAVRKKKFLLF